MQSEVSQAIHLDVKALYDRFPYPDYPVFLPLRWQDAFASHARFAQQILYQKAYPRLTLRHILIAGAGEVQANVLGHWECGHARLHACDLSPKQIRRAQWRSSLALQNIRYFIQDLAEDLPAEPQQFQHIDAYGVLHHLANPKQGLFRLVQKLETGGTLRMMVYNSEARSFLYHLRKLMFLLGLDAFQKSDLRIASQLLSLMREQVPALQERLTAMMPILQADSRLVDAIFHSREARLPLSYWLQAFQEADLEILSLGDRYAELDDLANPLYHPPTSQDLEIRLADRRFENNFEWILWKKPKSWKSSLTPPHSTLPLSLHWRSLPRIFTSYAETRTLSYLQKQSIWQQYLLSYRRPQSLSPRLLRSLPITSWQRLCRIGLVFPFQFPIAELQKAVLAPLSDSMEVPQLPESLAKLPLPLETLIERILIQKQLPLSRLHLIRQRMHAAQKI